MYYACSTTCFNIKDIYILAIQYIDGFRAILIKKDHVPIKSSSTETQSVVGDVRTASLNKIYINLCFNEARQCSQHRVEATIWMTEHLWQVPTTFEISLPYKAATPVPAPPRSCGSFKALR